MDLLSQLRSKLSEALAARSAKQAELDAIVATLEARDDSTPTEAEAAQFAELRTALVALDEERTALVAREAELVADAEKRAEADALAARLGSIPPAPGTPPAPIVQVRSEPLTYAQGSGHSYFRDMARAKAEGGGDVDARTRLARHGKEMEVEARTNMSTADSAGGDFVPPLWLVDKYLPLARAGRVTADLCHKETLPTGTDSINLPKVATGSTTAEQTQNAAVSNTDMTTGSISGAVTTLAGQQRFAMQLLDQSPINFDEVVFADLLADLAVRVDAYVLSKASIGILNVTGINAITYTDASPTVPEVYPKIADGVQQIHTGRFLPPQAHVMHPRRWAWCLAALDSSNRPLVVPTGQGPTNAFAGMTDVRAEGSVGSLQGLPVYLDPNVPINLGAGTNEDRIITARFDDLYLYESALRTRVLFETDADTLQVRLQVWEYAAFIGNRYPKSVSVVSGTGLITPSF